MSDKEINEHLVKTLNRTTDQLTALESEIDRLKQNLDCYIKQNQRQGAEIERLKASSEKLLKEQHRNTRHQAVEELLNLASKGCENPDEFITKLQGKIMNLKQIKPNNSIQEEKKEDPCCEFCGLQSCRDKTCKL